MKRPLGDYAPGVLAWIGLAAYIVGCDWWLIRHNKPTMSRTWGHALRMPLLGPILVGIWEGLGWHLSTSEPFQWAAEDDLNKNRF